ncbi:MAG: protein phosphatase 1 regulatory subunit 42 [Defluviitaleaceae bacterium]|nr:protein phosphatase 1 regulatory subunit 42 [Defluviitaleaceae bacterium]
MELQGTRISKYITTTSPAEGYIDVTFSLETNPGIWSFWFNITFDNTLFTPVYFAEGHELDSFRVITPTVDRLTNSNQLSFQANSTDVTNSVGLIATARFKANEQIYDGSGINFGDFFLVACNGFGDMETFSIININRMSPYAMLRSGIAIPNRGIDITHDFECSNFLLFVRNLIGVHGRPIYQADMINFQECISAIDLSGLGLTSLAGIHHLGSIMFMHVVYNELTEIDLSHSIFTELSFLHAGYNRLTSLDVSNTRRLFTLILNHNHIRSSDYITGLQYLYNSHPWIYLGQQRVDITSDFECLNFLMAVRDLLRVHGRSIYSTDFRWISMFNPFDFSGKGITSLAGLQHFQGVLMDFDFSNNELTDLNFPRLDIGSINLSNNRLRSLNVSNLSRLGSLDVSYNYFISTADVIGWRDFFNFYPQRVNNNVIISGSQNRIIRSGVSGFTDFSIVTQGIPSGFYTATLTGDIAGKSANPVFIDFNGRGTLTIRVNGVANGSILQSGRNQISVTLRDRHGFYSGSSEAFYLLIEPRLTSWVPTIQGVTIHSERASSPATAQTILRNNATREEVINGDFWNQVIIYEQFPSQQVRWYRVYLPACAQGSPNYIRINPGLLRSAHVAIFNENDFTNAIFDENLTLNNANPLFNMVTRPIHIGASGYYYIKISGDAGSNHEVRWSIGNNTQP